MLYLLVNLIDVTLLPLAIYFGYTQGRNAPHRMRGQLGIFWSIAGIFFAGTVGLAKWVQDVPAFPIITMSLTFFAIMGTAAEITLARRMRRGETLPDGSSAQ